MHANAFHIAPYDLILLGTIFIGLTFFMLLWFAKTNNRAANRFLAMALATVIFRMVRVLDIEFPLQFLLALGPLIYFYVLKITRPEYGFHPRNLIHFSPIVVRGWSSFCGSPDLNLQLLTTFSIAIYLYWSRRLITQFYQRQKFNDGDRYRQEFRGLDRQLVAFTLLWLLQIPWSILDEYSFYITSGVLMIWIAASGFLRTDTILTGRELFVSKSFPSIELRQKGLWLKKAMEMGLYYQDPDLSLSSLAEILGILPHELSRMINLVLKKNFHEFINEYRIRDVTRKMKDPANDHLTLLGIALDAGFNSKTTFNRTFKQITGLSPAEYKNDLKKERPFYNLERQKQFSEVISHYKSTSMFKNYFKIALRNLARNKVYSFINIAGLSLGLASAMLIILYVKDEVSFDRFHKGVNHIYRITSNNFDKKENKTSYTSNTGYLQGPRYTAHIPELLSFVRIQSGREDIRKGTDITSHDVLNVDSNFFSMFSFPLIEGNPKTCLKERHHMVLTEDEAKKQFGTVHALGKTLMVKEDSVFVPFLVTGVAKKCPQNSSIKFDILVPLIESSEEAQNNENWFSIFLNTFVVLPPGANVNAVEKKMQKFYDEDTKDAIRSLKVKFGEEAENWKSKPTLQTFLDMHLNKDMPADNGLSDASNPVYSYILSGIALFILLIASINFVNLTIAAVSKTCKGNRDPEGGRGRKKTTHYSIPGRVVFTLSACFLTCYSYCAAGIARFQ